MAAFRQTEEQIKINNLTLAMSVAEEFMDYVWETRDIQSAQLCTIAQAVEKASRHCYYMKHSAIKAAASSAISTSTNDSLNGTDTSNSNGSTSNERYATKPLVIADVTDNPGSGHYGDSTDVS